ncbi:MAG: superoxide dismutase family protein [Chloroflexi bacterium]|nr:superoxide dismutase family protein [Chloroflexota bacterium]
MSKLGICALVLLLAACTGGPESGKASATPNTDRFAAAPTNQRAQASLADGTGRSVGLVTFSEDRVGVRVDISVLGLPPGTHGWHVHAVGKCDGPAFTTAGAHYNPNNRTHGELSPTGPHAGDLGNFVVNSDGRGSGTFVTPLLSLAPGSPYSVSAAGGLAVVIHANADDERTDPSGNSGDRIACGVIKVIGG